MDVNGVSTYSATAAQAAAAPASAPVQAAEVVQPSAQTAEVSKKPAESADVSKSAKTTLENNVEKFEKQNGIATSDNLNKALEQINKSLASFNREMKVSVHSKLNRIMVKVMDTEQDKVIREIPPEKVLDAFAKALEMAGVLLDVKQ